jgi:DNA-binding response OmpR family regulator
VNAQRVLLVDADGPLRRAMAEQLGGLGYAVEQAGSAAAAALAIADGCALMVVAGAVPDASQAELCRSWIAARDTPPVALADDSGSAHALEAAGALTLAKPVRIAALARALAEAGRGAGQAELAFGPLRFRPATRELECGAGPPARLTEKEAAILVYLHGAGDRLVPRDELLGQVWGYAGAVTTHTLETHIYRLRRKLASGAPHGPSLLGEAGGYRLVLPG